MPVQIPALSWRIALRQTIIENLLHMNFSVCFFGFSIMYDNVQKSVILTSPFPPTYSDLP